MKTRRLRLFLLLFAPIACCAFGSTSPAANPDLLYIKPPLMGLGGGAVYATAIGDLNHDGKADFVRVGDDKVYVQLGAGDGSFGSSTPFPVGEQPARVLIAAMNADVHPDLVVANVNARTVSVLLGNGNGTFQNQIVTNVGLVATDITTTDFNKDGKADLLVTGYPSLAFEGWVSTLIGNGDGTFSNLTTFASSARSVNSQTCSIAAGDLNGDSFPDFVVSDRRTRAIVTFLNNAGQGFTRLVEMQPPGLYGAVRLEDFNGDGKLDLAYLSVADRDLGNAGVGHNVGVAMGNGDGTFGTLVNVGGAAPRMDGVTVYAAGPTADTFIHPVANLVVADMDGDGIRDLVTLADKSSGGLITYVAILRGRSNGTFVFGNRTTADYSSPWVSVGELNGDGTLDMIVTPNSSTAQAYLSGVVAPVFTSANGANFIIGRANTFNVTAPGNPAPSFSASGSLPSGVTFNAQGVLSGVPASGSEGTYPLTITAANSVGQTATQSFTLVVTRQDLLVTTAIDENDGSTDPSLGTGTSLREAINFANVQAGPQIVTFAPGLAGQSINLTIAGDNSSGPSAFRINNNITIQGLAGSSGVTLTRATADNLRPFYVHYGATLTLNDLTISNGKTSTDGGAVVSFGTLRMNRCTLVANDSNRNGGAIFSGGGGSGQTLILTNCTLANNRGNFTGGAINNQGTSNATLTNNTITGNRCTFDAGDNLGGGIFNAGGALLAINNIVARNTDHGTSVPSDISGTTINSASHHNLIGTGGSGGLMNGVNGNIVGVANPLLGPLASNGGPSQTVALLPGSPAFNAAASVTGVTTDQRGVQRPLSGTPDIGAYEYDAAVNESLVVTITADESNLTSDPTFGAGTSLREALKYAQSLGGAQTITFAPSLAGQTVTLSSAWSNADSYRSSSALAIESGQDILIQGPSSAPGITLKIADAAQLRHFTIASGGALTLANLTLTGGKAMLSGFNFGGSIWNFGNLSVHKCTFTGNSAGAEGGAIQSWGESPLLLIANSTFTGNQSNGNAGAINTGAISMVFRNVTISNNTANDGTALVLYKYPLTMVNGLIGGSGSEGVASSNGGTFSGESTNNLLSSATAPGLTTGTNGNQLGVPAIDLKLAALASNGGATKTVALLPGSLAINRGVAVAGISTDQRGKLRPQFGAVDVGAYEQTPFDTGQTIVTAGGAYWYLGPDAVGADLRIYREIAGQTPVDVGGLAARIGQANDGSVLVHNAGGAVYVRVGSTTGIGEGWQQLSSVVAADGATWFLGPETDGSDFSIYRWATGGLPVNVGGAAAQLSVTPEGFILARNASGALYYRAGSATGVGTAWAQVNQSLTVSSAADENNGVSDPAYGAGTSLREALTYAQSLSGPQTISFAPSMAGQAVTLNTGWDDANDENALEITGQITFQGTTTAPGVTIAMGQGLQKRHLYVTPGGNLTVSHLTFIGGNGPSYGGSIWSQGSLTVRNCTFTGNTAGVEGGAIQTWGDSPLLAIDNSTFTGNHSNGIAGAVDGGSASMTFRHVTMTNNTATNGNALVIWGHPLTMINSIIAGNANEGVGSANDGTFSAASTNNILSSATAPGLTNGANANQLGVPVSQLNFGAFANHGGPTSTTPLYAGSLAINNGVAILGMVTDQRGATRPSGPAPDIGAFEYAFPGELGYWREIHGLAINGSQDLATPAGDGVANLLKYAFNMAPNAGDLLKPNITVLPENGTAGLPFISIDEQGRLVIEFVRRKASSNPGITYTVETGDNLASLQVLDLSSATATEINGTWERVTVIDPAVTPKRFGRVRVTAD